MFIELTDIGASLAFVLGLVIFFKKVVPDVAEQIDKETLEVSDYACHVTGLPSDTAIEEARGGGALSEAGVSCPF